MNLRTLVVGLSLASVATFMVGTVALADSITVNPSFPPTTSTKKGTTTWSGTQTTQAGGSTYSGDYSASGTLNSSNCLDSAIATFSYTDSQKSTLVVTFATPLCTISPVNFTKISGTGLFQSAGGAGTLTYSSPDNWNFTTTSGPGFLDPPSGLSSTPELDSVALFGTGALGLAGYALTWRRARRKRPAN